MQRKKTTDGGKTRTHADFGETYGKPVEKLQMRPLIGKG